MTQSRAPAPATATRERGPAPLRAIASPGAAASLQSRIGQQGTQALIARAAALQGRAGSGGASTAATGSMRVSSPGEPAEVEAESTAKKVMRAAAAPVAAREADGAIARKATGPPTVTPNISADIASSTGSGAPLPARVRNFMEPRFKADFSKVRVHTGPRAEQLSAHLHARAFTVGNHIFFAKDQFKPESPEGQELIAHELTHTIQQGGAVQRSEAPEIRASAPQQVQRDWLPNPIDFAVRQAYLIPGFRMLTIVLGFNPINMSKVDRSAANILRALLELLPGGALLVDALNNSGVFEKAGAWVEQKLQTLGMAAASLKLAIDRFIDGVSAKDILNLDGVWERAKHIVTGPIDRIVDFGKGLIGDIIKFVKDAILLPLAKLAEPLPSWKLLTAVLGKNPITGEPVPRTADTVIGGFMKLIGQEEVWENMQKAGAVPRAWAWFQGAMAALMGFVGQLPGLAKSALQSLKLEDIVLLPRAFIKVGAVFGTFVGEFISWAGKAVWTLLEIIVDSFSPGAFGYIKRTGAALKSILKNPLPFVGNLVKAAKLGFLNFAGNILGHLKAGLMDWLLGALPGVYIPKAFSLGEIVKFAFSVLGISWQNIRQKLVKAVGEPAVAAMEAGFDIVQTLVKEGPAAAWEKIKEQLAELKDKVIGGIIDFVIDMVVKKAVPKLIAMFIPGAGFLGAILSIYETVMVFVEKISKILAVVKGFIDSIVAIASGAIGAAASKVEGILAGLLSLAINFLAGFAGLGKVADKVMGVIGKVRATIDKALDALIAWIVKTAKSLFAKAFGTKDKDKNQAPVAERWKKGMAEVEKYMTLPADEEREVGAFRAGLAPIKSKYGFLVLDLVPSGTGFIINAEMNPKGQKKLDDSRLINPNLIKPLNPPGSAAQKTRRFEKSKSGNSHLYYEDANGARWFWRPKNAVDGKWIKIPTNEFAAKAEAAANAQIQKDLPGFISFVKESKELTHSGFDLAGIVPGDGKALDQLIIGEVKAASSSGKRYLQLLRKNLVGTSEAGGRPKENKLSAITDNLRKNLQTELARLTTEGMDDLQAGAVGALVQGNVTIVLYFTAGVKMSEKTRHKLEVRVSAVLRGFMKSVLGMAPDEISDAIKNVKVEQPKVLK